MGNTKRLEQCPSRESSVSAPPSGSKAVFLQLELIGPGFTLRAQKRRGLSDIRGYNQAPWPAPSRYGSQTSITKPWPAHTPLPRGPKSAHGWRDGPQIGHSRMSPTSVLGAGGDKGLSGTHIPNFVVPAASLPATLQIGPWDPYPPPTAPGDRPRGSPASGMGRATMRTKGLRGLARRIRIREEIPA